MTFNLLTDDKNRCAFRKLFINTSLHYTMIHVFLSSHARTSIKRKSFFTSFFSHSFAALVPLHTVRIRNETNFPSTNYLSETRCLESQFSM